MAIVLFFDFFLCISSVQRGLYILRKDTGVIWLV